jgi:hypothetical protein
MTLEILAIIVLLNVAATVALWRTAVRQPEALKRSFLTKLRDSKPIAPQHPSKIIGKGFSSLISEMDQKFLDDFEDFANVVNWWLADEHVGRPWRLQELADAELNLQRSDLPGFGKRYAIFHNKMRMGTLEVAPRFDYSAEKPLVRTNFKVGWVRLLEFHNLRRFLFDIAMHVCDGRGNSPEYIQAHASIDCALTEVLWTAQRIYGSIETENGQHYGALELQVYGSAAWFIERRQVLRQRPAAE